VRRARIQLVAIEGFVFPRRWDCLLSGSPGLGSVSRPLILLVANEGLDFPKR
jgi:hypothetical protein